MFIETYYDERVIPLSSRNDPAIPYPELRGEELQVWRRYFPRQTPIENIRSSLFSETTPLPATREIERAQQMPSVFDRIEIWSRAKDPMAIGVIDGESPRYYSIARWGDALLTVEQVKKKLQFENLMLWLTWTIGAIFFAMIVFTSMLQSG